MGNFYKKMETKDRERVYGTAYKRGLRRGLKALTTLQTEVERIKNAPHTDMVEKDGYWEGYYKSLNNVLSIIDKLREEK